MPARSIFRPGFAHGFCVTSETAVFFYKCTAPYAPSAEGGILWNDPTLDIRWPSTADPQRFSLRKTCEWPSLSGRRSPLLFSF
ncbi:MAG: dTDP-4-dehydrorhamnose 3,5-epimerase family protein [Methylotenera sp.]